MLVYSTSTADIGPYDPQGYACPPAWEDDGWDAHNGCVHSIGYCADADWD